MLALWKMQVSKRTALATSTGFCFLRASQRTGGVLLNYVDMGKKSKRKGNKGIPARSVDERLIAIRKQDKENVKPGLVRNNITSLLRAFPDPSKAVVSFFANAAVRKRSSGYVVEPEYVKKGSLVMCTLRLKYPKRIELRSLGDSKQSALKCCSLKALQFLKDNDCMNERNSFLYEPRNGLTYDDFVDITQKYDRQRKSTRDIGLPEPPTNIFDVNKNVAASHDLNLRRNFSTSSKSNVRGQVSEKSKPEPKQSKLAQQPKSVIHNYYSLVSNYLEEDFKVTPHYDQSANKAPQWTCTYAIKWPEEKTFAKSGRTKKESADRVCSEIVGYLDALKVVDRRGRPVFNEERSAKKKRAAKVISLKSTTVEKLAEIDNVYRQRLLGNLTDSADDLTDAAADENEGLFSRQVRTTIFRSPDFYAAKEKTVLPISKLKSEIIDVVGSNRVVIITGEPGCGKSTRVPQYILEGWAKGGAPDGTPCRIVVTQPRRIAAISLAERVSYERDENVGRTVGYQVRLENSFSPKTGRILYCTTGILLRKMQSDPNLRDCSHIVLDEAHERDVNTDLLMNLLRRALKQNEHLRVVVMSATIDTGTFCGYFDDAPLFHVPGFTYPVKQHFIDECGSVDFSRTLEMCEGKNPNVVCEDVARAVEHVHRERPDGAILCFLPGWEDIKAVAGLLAGRPDMQVLCLHSRLSMRDQKLIFARPPRATRKVILSTNIAETSVTIDDVAYVVDTGIQKEARFDSGKGVTCLDNSWISRANVRQRRGRAGRCRPGESFHLYPRRKSEAFDEFPVPEILRTSLTKIVLDGKVYTNDADAAEFLGRLVTPPGAEAVRLAVSELVDLELLDAGERLTPLGRTLANFQLEPKLAKTMVNAMVFRCATPIVDIVTLFSEEKELFAGGLYSKDQVKRVKREFSRVSDHLALMKMFEQWLEYAEAGEQHCARRFCAENSLVEAKLRTLQQLRDIHFEYLVKYLKDVLPISDSLSDNDELIKGVLLSGVGTLIEHSEKVKGKKKKHALLTRNGHNAMITSESVNSKRSTYSSDYLIYINEKVSSVRRTSIIRETSLVSLLTVLLFKNNKIILEELPREDYSADIDSTDQVLMTLENTKYRYICDRRQADVIIRCKKALRSMLQYYVFQLTSGGEYNPEVNKDWNRILSILNKTLEEVQI